VKAPDARFRKPPCLSGFGYVQSIAGSRHVGALGDGDAKIVAAGDGEVCNVAVEPEQETISIPVNRGSQPRMHE
jgi:hypothetical protein